MEKDYCKIIPDTNDIIAQWVCEGLKTDTGWLQNYITFGVLYKTKIVAGLIFHDIHYGQDVTWTIYSRDRHWCTRRVIKTFMQIAFEDFKCRRINLLVNPDNKICLDFVTRLGFVKEGYLRRFRENGEDCYILSLLKTENKYI